ncbi:MAG: TAXI family TRAP transporter solute-binding subunit [Rhodospirillales bacterium]|nr:TAXI family TRAP transporter solute-binding subunit [Rhodospirillales bacterium]MDH3910212.1 TAXI family TRAP transporter solute-binding subunit [Rhodospirillales bacterium]MDH3920050.1 TAXI family TRAP transporter solute-binding subunit [Rhodospirillales bacterium]MDH3966323.1 TAXI family TRAP transporter solute-binding subunit [Rhodospirillales bacterium]
MRRLFLFVLFLGLAAGGGARGAERIVVVGTAPVAGVYYPAGGALCRLVNQARQDHGLRCLVESTAGSDDNLRRLRAGELDFALLQSDWQYYAGQKDAGAKPREGEAKEDEAAGSEANVALRAVLSLHAQPFTLLASPESDIAKLEDLKGKRVNLGPAGSVQRAAGEVLVEALGWKKTDFAEVAQMAAGEQVEALCGGRIDAFLMPISHPNGLIGAATDRCRARLVPVEGRAVDLLLATWPFYSRAVIAGGTYLANPGSVRTFGLRATLVTSEKTPDETVYRIVQSLFEQIDAFRAQHPALAELEPSDMVSQGNSLALHEGALRYYRERGWK